jgi:hypothetical protein
MADDAYGENVWEPQLPEVWDGIYGRRSYCRDRLDRRGP